MLLNLQMPLYKLMVVYGNGESEVIASAVEDKPTISHLTDFKKHNNTTRAQCIIADKDMVERNKFSEKISNANLLIYTF